MIGTMNQPFFLRLPRWVYLVLGVLLGIPLGIASVRLTTPATDTTRGASAVSTMERWAQAAEQGDTATMLSLMPAGDLQTTFWQDAWGSAYRTKRIAPGFVLSAIEERGATTAAIVHFKQDASANYPAFCARIEVVNGLVATPGRPYDCAFPPPSAAP